MKTRVFAQRRSEETAKRVTKQDGARKGDARRTRSQTVREMIPTSQDHDHAEEQASILFAGSAKLHRGGRGLPRSGFFREANSSSEKPKAQGGLANTALKVTTSVRSRSTGRATSRSASKSSKRLEVQSKEFAGNLSCRSSRSSIKNPTPRQLRESADCRQSPTEIYVQLGILYYQQGESRKRGLLVKALVRHGRPQRKFSWADSVFQNGMTTR